MLPISTFYPGAIVSDKYRSSIRFHPDPTDYALLDFKPKALRFSPSTSALILNESYSGCAILMTSEVVIPTKTKVKIKVGKLDPILGEIIWVKNLEENIFKVGIKLLE